MIDDDPFELVALNVSTLISYIIWIIEPYSWKTAGKHCGLFLQSSMFIWHII